MDLYGSTDRVGLLDYGSTIYVSGDGSSSGISVYDGLDSTNSSIALSANMGRVLLANFNSVSGQISQITLGLSNLESSVNSHINNSSLHVSSDQRNILSMFYYDSVSDSIVSLKPFSSVGNISAYSSLGAQSEYISIKLTDWQSVLDRIAALEQLHP